MKSKEKQKTKTKWKLSLNMPVNIINVNTSIKTKDLVMWMIQLNIVYIKLTSKIIIQARSQDIRTIYKNQLYLYICQQ